MPDECDLRTANGEPGVTCDEEACPFWRVVEHVEGATGNGCAIKHFRLLGDEKLAEWLLSVKERVEKQDPLGQRMPLPPL